MEFGLIRSNNSTGRFHGQIKDGWQHSALTRPETCLYPDWDLNCDSASQQLALLKFEPLRTEGPGPRVVFVVMDCSDAKMVVLS